MGKSERGTERDGVIEEHAEVDRGREMKRERERERKKQRQRENKRKRHHDTVICAEGERELGTQDLSDRER